MLFVQPVLTTFQSDYADGRLRSNHERNESRKLDSMEKMTDGSTLSWRLKLDSAWQSRSFREEFEAECGFLPSDELHPERWREDSGAYYRSFLIWATKRLGLEKQAPPAIKAKL
jgi:hypothetical protein